MADQIIQPQLLTHLRNDLNSHIANALINVDGQIKTYPIFKTAIDGMKVIKYVYVDDVQVQGHIQNVTLVDSEGRALAIKPTSIIKGDSGLLVAFEFEIKVEVANS